MREGVPKLIEMMFVRSDLVTIKLLHGMTTTMKVPGISHRIGASSPVSMVGKYSLREAM